MANLRIFVGPCDDQGRIYINEELKMKTQLNVPKVYEEDNLADGEYRIRFELWNTGGWGWHYSVEVRADDKRIGPLAAQGGSGAYNGRIDEETTEWVLIVKNGKAESII